MAQAKGLTAAQAKRLVGTTQAELEADADALLADFPSPVTPKAPTADGQGKVGTSLEGTAQLTRADLAQMKPEDIEKARLGGRLNKVLGIS